MDAAATIGNRFVAYLAVDSALDANQVVSAIEIYDAKDASGL